MSPGEAWRLTNELLSDVSSHVCVAMAEWDYPTSREAMVLADLYDLEWQSVKRRGQFKPYPRPFQIDGRKKFGKTDLTPEQAREALRRVGPMPRHVTRDGRVIPATRKQLAYWTRKAVST